MAKKLNHGCLQQDEIRELFIQDKKKSVVMGELAVKMENIQKTTDRLERKFDIFVETANKTYATKSELFTVKSELKEYNLIQDKEISWNKDKIIDLLFKVATIGSLLFVIGKTSGWWG